MWSRVDALLQDAVDQGVIPGCAICIRTADDVLHQHAVGQAEVRPNPRQATNDTPWDLASLTKVLVATPITMAMVAEGRIDLGAPVRSVITDAPEGVTVAHCLSHTSGLPPWRAFVDDIDPSRSGTDDARDLALWLARSTTVDAPPGEVHAYSDLGFMLLCTTLERLGGACIDALFERYVRSPSGVDLRWGWPQAAATEDCPVRGEVMVGEVHDLNAWLMGGVSSHAGIFGTAAGVAASAAWQLRAWQGDASTGLDPAVVQRFWRHEAVGSHHLGWDGVTEGACSAGPRWPLDGVGHLAFTGCSVWIAPRAGICVAVTSNRVHPEIEGGSVPNAAMHPRYAAFKALRPALHSAVVEALETLDRWPL